MDDVNEGAAELSRPMGLQMDTDVLEDELDKLLEEDLEEQFVAPVSAVMSGVVYIL